MKEYDASLEQFVESISDTGMMDILREISDLIAQRGRCGIVNIISMMGMFDTDFSNYERTDTSKGLIVLFVSDASVYINSENILMQG